MEIKEINDVEVFLKYLRIKNDDLFKSKGIKMWSDDSLSVTGLNEVYNTYQMFLAIKNNDVIGCFILLEKDYSYWNNQENLDSAYYIHKLVVLPKYNGNGYAKEIIASIKEYALKRNKKYLRLDCRLHNNALNNLYESVGFKIKRPMISKFSGEMNLREFKL